MQQLCRVAVASGHHAWLHVNDQFISRRNKRTTVVTMQIAMSQNEETEIYEHRTTRRPNNLWSVTKMQHSARDETASFA